MDTTQLEHLLTQYQLGTLDGEGQRRLRQALVESAEVRGHAARWMQNESLLRGELLMGEVARLFTDQSGTVPAPHLPAPSQPARGDESRPRHAHPASTFHSPRTTSRWLGAIAVGLAGLLLANGWLAWRQLQPADAPEVASQTPPPPPAQLVHGRLLDTTVCVWSTADGVAPTTGQRLVEGDSFQLLEGIATIALDYGETKASLEVEGPAALMLARGGVASLRYGKITFKVEGTTGKSFPLETAFGRVVAQPGSEAGVVSFGSKGQVHVFEGEVAVLSAWLTPGEGELVSQEVVRQGSALMLTNVGGNTLQTKRVAADRSYFTPNISMEADFLEVSPAYVEAVEAASPVAYWRFEEVADGTTPCHLPGGPPLKVQGEVSWVGPEGNRAVEFGMSPNAGLLLCDHNWDATLAGDFSIEFWMKPSHYHYGAMVGLAGPFQERIRMNLYGIGVELGGTYLANDYQKPRQVRTFYRATLGVVGGASAFSGDDHEYMARRWQYVVVAHRQANLELYLDGELVDTVPTTGSTPPGLQLLLGQLYTGSVFRPYVGDLDEVSIYDRALPADEILQHYQLLRPEAVSDPLEAPAAATVGDGAMAGFTNRSEPRESQTEYSPTNSIVKKAI